MRTPMQSTQIVLQPLVSNESRRGGRLRPSFVRQIGTAEAVKLSVSLLALLSIALPALAQKSPHDSGEPVPFGTDARLQ